MIVPDVGSGAVHPSLYPAAGPQPSIAVLFPFQAQACVCGLPILCPISCVTHSTDHENVGTGTILVERLALNATWYWVEQMTSTYAIPPPSVRVLSKCASRPL